MALLNGFREVKDRSVVFSQSLKSLDMIQSLLEKSDPPFQCLRIDGSTPQMTRERLIKRSVSHSATVAIPSCCHIRARPTLFVTVCCLSTTPPPPSVRVCVLLTSRFNDTSSKMKQKPDVMLVSTRAGGEGKEGLSKARM